MLDDPAFTKMEEDFYDWWSDVLSHYSPERYKEFMSDVAQAMTYENFAKAAFMAGVKMERAAAVAKRNR